LLLATGAERGKESELRDGKESELRDVDVPRSLK
jgi:hypothetical protein